MRTPLLPLQEIHDQVLKTLLDWQREGEAMDWGTEGGASDYRLFYLRRTHDASFEKGYWFPGNDSYLLISFWAGSDSRNRTPNAYLRLHRTQGCQAFYTARDSEDKQGFFKGLIKKHSAFARYKSKQTAGLWHTEKLGDLHEWPRVLEHYYYHDKRQIDNALAELEGAGIGAEFETKFNFLDQGGFDRSLSHVLAQQAEVLKAQRINKLNQLLPDSNLANTSQPPGNAIGLAGFSISRYQGINYSEVNNLNLASRWLFLTGENGFGKTSVLQAIAHALAGPRDDSSYYDVPPSRQVSQQSGRSYPRMSMRVANPAQLRFDYWRGSDPVSVVKTVGWEEEQVKGYLGPLLVAYGPLRLGILDEAAQNQSTKQQDNTASLFNPVSARLYNADYELNQAALTNKSSRFATLKQLISSVTGGLIADVSVDPSTGLVTYQEAVDEKEIVAPNTPFEQLATGYQSLINLVVDMYLRLTAAQPDVKQPEKLIGLVLIDELENHLHPRLQRLLPISLQKLFPLVQFVVSTHSPIPLLGSPPDAQFLRVDRTLKSGITLQKLDISISNLLPNAILSSPIFGFQELVPVSHSGEEWVRTENSFAQVQANDAQRAEIDGYLTTQKQQELLAMLREDNE
jgi:hypothetical protein